MRRMLALLLSSALAQIDFAQVTTQSVSVPPGTGVEIELLQDVSSETLKAGQVIPFRLVRPIELSGETLLPAGTPAAGIVETVHTARKWGKSGAFNLTLQPLKLADGTILRIDFPRPGPRRKSGKGQKVAEGTAAVAVLPGVLGVYFPFFPLIPVALIAGARKGKAFTVRSGERYLVYVTSTEAAPAPTPKEPPSPQ
jgi:hypothetical protein